MGEISPEKRSGCGLLNAVFGRRSIWPRRSTSTGSLHTFTPNNNVNLVQSMPASRRQSGGFEGSTILDSSDAPLHKQVDRVIARPGQNHARSPPVYQQHHPPPMAAAKSSPSQQGHGQARKVPRNGLGISGELESMITDHQQSKGAGKLVRASSSNVMLFGNLGNLRQQGSNGNSTANNVLDYLPKTGKEEQSPASGKYSTSVIGNVVKKIEKPSLCRAISTRMDPEQLKILGNEDYKNGRFAEALALYDAAISIDPNKASYRSNKSAALTALGRLLEAAFECREAIRIDPYYQRAHNRLATLYVRLGEAEKAAYHFKQAGAEADPDSMNKSRKVQVHLNKCTEVKRQRDWNTLIKEATLAIAAGADSAPLIFSLKAEALMKLHKLQEADETMAKGPNFDIDECIKFFGPIGSTSLLLVHAQVNMVVGRFDDAVAAAERASRLDSNNKEVNTVLRRTKAVALARSNGNDLFKAARYSEACVAYGEGLNHDPYNAVLLCNRAACRSKLGQFEKAIEDCSAALGVRPSYSKARLRRGDCYAKLGKWEACIQDCEMLLTENTNDEEVEKLLKEARAWRRHGSRDMKNGCVHSNEVVLVSSNECFRDYVTSPGISVVLFFRKLSDSTIMQFIENLHKRYPSVNFLKVEVKDNPSIAKSEGINSLPAFIIYKNGSRAREIPGDSHDLLESSIKFYVSS
ncbi:inactive TPR repeat-containing thioredoxin TTL3-like [Olea europaea var. sylvestris]|uniref:inactive TPR repeat-containing thioredoxin TTL3-like n=1 Tax=Olea europaea var. sylvestris TaxID=158386 RepID=UPI000C1D7EDC|nr:inactive TPR repeat-containing thioredoxin TTL3-like [Olea europaea var. sylvestris]